MGRNKNEDGSKVDKNDPLNYIGLDPKGQPFKFLEEEGYMNNVKTKLHFKPTAYPFEGWEKLEGSSYHKTKWVPSDKRREDTAARRRLERDPNHAMWESSHALLRWWHVRINLLGTDEEGRQILTIRKGQSEPIYIRVGRLIEVFYKGEKVI